MLKLSTGDSLSFWRGAGPTRRRLMVAALSYNGRQALCRRGRRWSRQEDRTDGSLRGELFLGRCYCLLPPPGCAVILFKSIVEYPR